MTLLFAILFTLLSAYALLLLVLAAGFLKAPEFYSSTHGAQLPFSIIICARNEEQNIVRCIKSILDQDYEKSLIQLIVVDDGSSDRTAELASRVLSASGIKYQIIRQQRQEGKKAGITAAMKLAAHANIVTRDADTFTQGSTWLQALSQFLKATGADLVIAPVKLTDNSGLLWALQAIESIVLNLISCGSAELNAPFLASGANLCFRKSLFERTNGYSGHMHIASGDDVLFLEDAKRTGDVKIRYLKSPEAIVLTYPCRSFGELKRQKTRWAGKFLVNRNPLNFLLALLTAAVNAGWLLCFACALLLPDFARPALFFVLAKLLVDILLLFLAARFLKNQALGWYALPVGCIYPLYALTVAIGSVFLKRQWK